MMKQFYHHIYVATVINIAKENLTYRLNFTKLIDKFTLSLSESTGIRNPDLYVLHGSNPSGSFKSMFTTKPEKALRANLD